MGIYMKDTFSGRSLFGKTRQAVLALLYGQTDTAFYTKQILDIVKSGRGTVQRELQNLTDAGIIRREVKGRQVYYQANDKNPIFSELKNIVRKTFGVANVIRESLSGVRRNIRVAFIFGSVARSTDGKASDIDIMIIGDAPVDEIIAALSPAEETLRREINSVVYSTAEFKKRVAEKHHFVTNVTEGEKIFIIGDEDEFGKLADR